MSTRWFNVPPERDKSSDTHAMTALSAVCNTIVACAIVALVIIAIASL